MARAGQVSAVNLAAIPGATTNIDAIPRRRFSVMYRPRGLVFGETKGRFRLRREYQAALCEVLAPDRRHLVP
ncbi:MAG: hypothetical protein CMJ18_21225 [Phycisphaeraceae bacterium]|nr:hypothetical protein [Phycisphaeraceae bacterium]